MEQTATLSLYVLHGWSSAQDNLCKTLAHNSRSCGQCDNITVQLTFYIFFGVLNLSLN